MIRTSTNYSMKDKGKGIMEEPEKPTKRKDQIRYDEEVSQRLQAKLHVKLEEEDRLWMVLSAIVRAEGSSKRAGEDLQQESTKKEKMDDVKETVELQSLMEVIPDEEEVIVDVIPLASKPPSYYCWKLRLLVKKLMLSVEVSAARVNQVNAAS
ncbi:hypothetical protein Tco_0059409 [Tanacetum coccineum]